MEEYKQNYNAADHRRNGKIIKIKSLWFDEELNKVYEENKGSV